MIASLPVAMLVAVVLASGAIIAGARLALLVRAGALPPRRAALIAGLQCGGALFLYLTLFPPEVTRSAGVMTVLTAAAESGGARGTVVALPEFNGRAGDPVPDLATALRRHPRVSALEVRGMGLTPRDLDAARGLAVSFQAAALPRGLVELQLPARVTSGSPWTLRGQAELVPGGRVELRDPAGVLAAQAELDEGGTFALPALARAPGAVMFELRLLGADASEIERVDVPVAVTAGGRPRVVMLAGAPSPELRFLRRWAVDAGIELDARVQLGRDISLGARPEVDAAMLRDADLLILDERAWRGLDDEQHALLMAALREGLGMLLRLGDVLNDEDRRALAVLGFTAENVAPEDTAVWLAPQPGSAGVTPGTGAAGIALTRRPLRIAAGDGAVLLRSAAAEPLAVWRNERLGRLGVWWLEDSYRLALGGEPAAFASLWSEVVATLGRPGETMPLDPGIDAGTHQRRVLCGLKPGAEVLAPSGGNIPLLPGEDACAGYWPAVAGWHAVRQDGDEVLFHVRPTGSSPGLDAGRTQAATRLLAAQPHAPRAVESVSARGSPWGFFCALLIALASGWWLERRHRRA